MQSERVYDQSHLGPGYYDYHKPFGAACHNRMHIGTKYKELRNLNLPGPGGYDYTNG